MVCLLHTEPEPLGDRSLFISHPVSLATLIYCPELLGNDRKFKTVNASSRNRFPLAQPQRWGEALRQVRGVQSRDVPPVY